ncbi:MAG: hypothetical protein AAGI03_02280 [Pseudomonadota bacterium]
MTDRTDAVARMLETVDLLAKMTASISDRLDKHREELGDVKEMLQRALQETRDRRGAEVSAAEGTSTDAVQVHLILQELSQRITDLGALYGEADRYFERVKAGGRMSSVSSWWPWRVPLLVVLGFSAGLSVGALA